MIVVGVVVILITLAVIIGDTEIAVAVVSVLSGEIVAITTFCCCNKCSSTNDNNNRNRCFCDITNK